MAAITLSASLADLAGTAALELDVGNVKQLFETLAQRYPKLVDQLDQVAVAIDGDIYQDAWLQAIAPDSDVHLFPKIGGG